MSTNLSSTTSAPPRKSSTIGIGFLANARRLRALVRVIQANTNTNYITHSEVIEHRAEHTRRWAHFRRSMLADDIRRAIRRHKRGEGGVLAATRGRAILGVAVLSYDLKHRYGIVEDIVVNAHHRGEGIGHRLMAAATDAMRDAGLENVILESGIRNESAHEFFRRHGFREAAKMFLKHLHDRERDRD
jgi:ribosomal protein S18 acetylase RimI-like enzyme